MADWNDATNGDSWQQEATSFTGDTWNEQTAPLAEDVGHPWQEQAAPQVEEGGRMYGVVKRWTEKGFGFIDREDGNGSVFCHASECPGRNPLVQGSKVSFTFEADAKSGKAKDVQIEEAAVEAEKGPRERGVIKNWNAHKGFGFIGRDSGDADAFVHKRDCGGVDFAKGQAVSFVIGEGHKGAAAKEVQVEDGGGVEEPTISWEEEDQGDRQLGKVKSYNEEKGFAFIAPCTGGGDLFSHKKEFGGLEPSIGLPVSYIVEGTEKGDSAKKVRQEDSVPEPVLSDEGREFGKVRNFLPEKGFGFVIWKGGEEAIVFDKETNGLSLEKDMCVSFKYEEGAKGPLAKDIRQEDPARVARVTAKVQYGKVETYLDPTEKKPTNGYGFIVPFESPGYGAPRKQEPETNVSFIVLPARKGIQAASVKIADPPKKEEEGKKGDGHENGFGSGIGELQINDTTKAVAADAPAEETSGGGGWGTWD